MQLSCMGVEWSKTFPGRISDKKILKINILREAEIENTPTEIVASLSLCQFFVSGYVVCNFHSRGWDFRVILLRQQSLLLELFGNTNFSLKHSPLTGLRRNWQARHTRLFWLYIITRQIILAVSPFTGRSLDTACQLYPFPYVPQLTQYKSEYLQTITLSNCNSKQIS